MKKMLKGVITSIFAMSLLIPTTIVANAATNNVPAGEITGQDIQKNYIDKANPGDEIIFNSGTTIIGGFTVNKPLTLKGNGAKLYMTNSTETNAAGVWGGIFVDISDSSQQTVIDKFDIYGYNVPTDASSAQEASVNIVIGKGKNITISNNTIRIGQFVDGSSEPVSQSTTCMGFATYTNNGISDITLSKNTFKPVQNATGFSAFFIGTGASNITLDTNTISGDFARYSASNGNNVTIKNNTFDGTHNITGVAGKAWTVGNPLSIRGPYTTITGNKFLSETNIYCVLLDKSSDTVATNAHLEGNYFVTIPAGKTNPDIDPDYANDMVGIIANADTTFRVDADGYSYAKNNDSKFHGQLGTSYLFGKALPSTSTGTTTSTTTTYVPTYTTSTGDPYVYEGTNTTSTPSNTTSTPQAIENAVITAKNITINAGEEFDIMDGVKAIDLGGKGANITDDVKVTGAINTGVPGKYTVTYRVTGENGVTVTKKVTITVKGEKSKTEEPAKPQGAQKCTPNVSNSPCGL